MPTKSLQEIDFGDLEAPLFFAWHMTNRCNLNCIHCLWDSGPQGAWPDELTVEEALRVCQEILDLQIPYVALSGGEPLLCRAFWPTCEFLTGNGLDLKIETNGQLINRKVASRLARCKLRSVQVSIDGLTQETYSRMRPGAKLSKALDGIRCLVEEGVATEIVYVPAKFNAHEAESLIDLAVEMGVKAFYTGKTMYIGRAVTYWDVIGLSEQEDQAVSQRIDGKAAQYRDRMVVLYYPYSVVEELRYRLEHPAASLLLMANGKVKLIGSMPFVCGDVRKHSLAEIWERYQKAWRRPEVAQYVNAVVNDPSRLAEALDFIELNP